MLQSLTPCPHLERNQLIEVICQLRFPTILSIETREPAEFQDAIRAMFPRYAVRKDQLPPKMVNGPQGAKLETVAPITNYHFVSADGTRKINLTRNFISLSTVAYSRWGEFAAQFDQPLAEFIRLYQPAFFERIGLRYLNAFSRAALGLESKSWSELISAAYLGPLSQQDVEETDLIKLSLDTELSLSGSCRARIHSGTGLVKRNIPGIEQDKEIKFILDLDLSMPGQIEPRMAAAGLETLHGHATGLFRAAIHDPLYRAMEPLE